MTLVSARHGGAGRLSNLANAVGPETAFAEGSPLVAPNGIASDGKFFYVADSDAEAWANEFAESLWRTGTLACPSAPEDRQECLSSTEIGWPQPLGISPLEPAVMSTQRVVTP